MTQSTPVWGWDAQGWGSCSGRPKLASQTPAPPGYSPAVSLAEIKGLVPHGHNRAVPTGARGAGTGTSLPSQARQLEPAWFQQNRRTAMPRGVISHQKMMVPHQRHGGQG